MLIMSHIEQLRDFSKSKAHVLFVRDIIMEFLSHIFVVICIICIFYI